MTAPIPLLLKLAAATATGTAALLSFSHHHRLTVIRSLRQDIHDALVHLRACDGRPGENSGDPPAILVTGFRGHGKSAFINTACRALAGESGPLLLRSVTAPLGFPQATGDRWNVRVAVAGSGGRWEEEKVAADECVALELIDAPPLPDPAVMTLGDVEAAFDVGSGGGARPPECVVLVLRCCKPAMERHLCVRRVGDIAGVARDRGLRVVVVLTHRRSLRSRKQAEQLRCEVAVGARTDCVYFIENYTANSSARGGLLNAVRNDFDTHYAVLAIIRQCVEFAGLNRNQIHRKLVSLATLNNEKREAVVD